MRIIPSCEKCLYEKQLERVSLCNDETLKNKYMRDIKNILIARRDEDTAPYMIYLFNKVFSEYFGNVESYADIKKKYNSLVLSMEKSIEKKIESSIDPLLTALVYSRIGNYIDFGAMSDVSEEVFIQMLEDKAREGIDALVYKLFVDKCSDGKTFLLITDNCGEIVLDKLLVRQLKQKFPWLDITVMVRGEETLNDATIEDAIFCGMADEVNVITNGNGVAGTIPDLLNENVKKIFYESDIVLAKGQGNYESMTDCGRDAFYSFLCKCDLFINRFNVSRFTGMFVHNEC